MEKDKVWAHIKKKGKFCKTKAYIKIFGFNGEMFAIKCFHCFRELTFIVALMLTEVPTKNTNYPINLRDWRLVAL